MAKRQMPQQGFYVDNRFPGHAIYSTGTAKANMYFSLDNHGPQWNYLLWTCLPGKKELETNFTYHSTLPDGFPPLSVNSLLKMGIKSFSY